MIVVGGCFWLLLVGGIVVGGMVVGGRVVMMVSSMGVLIMYYRFKV